MTQILIVIVKAYRLLLSPWIGSSCRFEPTCSVYAIGALEAHGAWRGSGLSAWRIVRCGPWCDGGHDPVPSTKVQPKGDSDSVVRAPIFSRLLDSERPSSSN